MRNKLWKKLLAGLLAVTIAGTPVISSAMAEERITSGATEEADQTKQEEEQITGTESADTTERVETKSTETVEAGTEDTETKDTETENSETDENYELTWNNPDMDNMAGLLSVSVTSEKPFETGDSLDVQEMEQSEDYDALLESLQQELAGEQLEIGDVYLTEELVITDASGNVAEDYQNLLVETYLEDASVLQEGRLYHYTSDEVWEQIDYEVSGDTEEETDCVQFMTQELGRFCFVAVAEQTYEEDTEDKIDTFSEDEVDTTTPTAILYSASGDIDKNKDGELVFQIGNAVDPDKGTVVATYTGFDTNTKVYAPWQGYMQYSIRKVVFKDKIKPKCTSQWFRGLRSIRNTNSGSNGYGYYSEVKTIEGLENLDTSEVTDMSSMFEGCIYLREIDLSNFNTEKVTTMEKMFYHCNRLLSLDVSSFDTSNVTNMSYMFCDITPSTNTVKTLDLKNFNTHNVTDMSYMFSNNAALELLDIRGFDTGNVTDMSYMFNGSYNIEILGLEDFNTSKVTNMCSMFYQTGDKNLDLSSFDTHNVTNMYRMFYNAYEIQTLDVSSFDTSNVTNMDCMFYNLYKLKKLDVGNFNTQKVIYMDSIFYKVSGVEFLDLKGFDMSNARDITYLLSGCTNIKWIRLNQKAKIVSNSEPNTAKWKNIETGEIYDSLSKVTGALTETSTLGRAVTMPFNTCGGTPASYKVETYYMDKFENVQVEVPDREGYVFDGWYTESAGGEKMEADSSMAQDMYYAHWIPNNYTLLLNPNGPQTEDVEIPMKYGESYYLNKGTFSYDGYVLTGWNTRRNGTGTAYDANVQVGNLTAVDGDTVILYAQWSPASRYVTVTFDTNGGEPIESRQLTKGASIGRIADASRPGYTFLGWHMGTETGYSVTERTTISKDCTIVAAWGKNPTVTFDGNGIVANTVKNLQYNSKIGKLPSYAVNSTRYQTFLGWYTEADGGKQITSDQRVKEDVTYYAHWGWKTRFYTNGGKFTGTEDYAAQEDSNYTITKLPEVTREGYILKGWFRKDGTQVQDGDTLNLSEDVTLTAEWTVQDMIVVTLDLNGGTYYYYDKAMKYVKGQALKGLYSPTRKGYTFVGWAAEDGRFYQNGDILQTDLTLKAQWKQNIYTVTFNPGSGTMYDSLKTKTVPYGATINTIPGARWKDYVLKGWYTERDGQGDKLEKETQITGNVTYYAYYEPYSGGKEADAYSYTFGAEWSNASTSTVDNYNDNLEYHVSGFNYSADAASLHVRFELNKSDDDTVALPEGAVTIRIPKYILKDRGGRWIGTNNLSVNLPKYPDKRNGMYFSYMEDGDDYLLINNQELSGGAGIDLTISYTVRNYLSQMAGGAQDIYGNYLDGYPYYSGKVPIRIKIDADKDGTVDAEDEKDLSVEVHTSPSKDSSMYVNSILYTWNSSWGTKPEDAEDYFYINWAIQRNQNGSQPVSSIVTLDTVHDGTLVKLNAGTFSGWGTSNGSIIMKYPRSLLDNAPAEGIKLMNQAIVTSTWQSGYKEEAAVGASTTIYPGEIPTGEYSKVRSNSSPISGAQEDLVSDKKKLSLGWSTTYGGSNPGSSITWDDNTKTYNSKSRTIEVTDGQPGDLLYSSGSAKNKYVWEPDTGNVELSDDDYYISYLNIHLTEYDNEQQDGKWLQSTRHSNSEDYEGIEIYLRYRNSQNFVYYKTIYQFGDNYNKCELPDGVVGYKILHTSKFYRTVLYCFAEFTLKPTEHMTKLIGNDLSGGVSSIIKNKSICRIWDTEDPTNIIFEKESAGTGSDSASGVLYELTKSTTYQYAAKYAAEESSVIFDAAAGTQDSPMYIVGWNYNTSSSRKSLMQSGVFYDLLPKGTTVDEDSIFGIPLTGNMSSASNGAGAYLSWKNSSSKLDAALYNVKFQKDWEGSGRTMMIIQWSAPEDQKATGMQFWYLLHNTYENVVDCGTSLENDVAHIDTSTSTAIPYSCSGKQSIISEPSYYDELQKQYNGRISYARAFTNYIPVSAFSWGYDKSVRGQSGSYDHNADSLPNENYTYKLTYNQSDVAKSRQIQFYDILEYGLEQEDGSFMKSEWQGTLVSVNVDSAKRKLTENSDHIHCAPVVYYATKDKASFTEADYDITNGETWSTTAPEDLSLVTAIAVDCSKNEDGSDFVLSGRQSLAVYITMKAPVEAEFYNKNTYNESYVYSAKNDEAVQTFLKSDAQVTLKDVEPELHKTSEPETGTDFEPATVFKDMSLDYTLRITNPDDKLHLHEIVIEDELPDGLLLDQQNITVQFGEDNSEVKLTDSPRISMSRSNSKLIFTLKSLLAGETVCIKIPTIVNIEEGLLVNTSKITGVNGMEREILSETTYHKVDPYDPEFKLTLQKKNIDGKLIGGAVLELTGRGIYDSEDITPIRWTTVEGQEHVVTLAPGDYILTEITSPDGYVIADPVNIHLTGDQIVQMVDAEDTEFTVNKLWNDGEKKISRPDEVEMELYQDDTYLKDITVKKADGWTTTVTKLPKYPVSDPTHIYQYSVKEKAVDGYVATSYKISEDGLCEDVTNTATRKIAGQKIWADTTDETRPEQVEIRLIRDGVEIDSTEVSEATEWKYEFTGLLRYDENGKKYNYTVKEEYLPDYKADYMVKDAEGLAVTIDYATENVNCDWFYLYYYGENGKLYRAGKYGGNTTKKTQIFYIPSTEFWLEFRSDYSVTYYGVKVTNVEALDTSPDIIGSVVATVPSGYKETDVGDDYTKIETAHSYGNNQQLRWHYTGPLAGSGTDITNTKIPDYSTVIEIIKADQDSNPLAGAKLELLDQNNNVIQSWTSETTPEKFNGIAPGNYTLHEVEAPDGYFLAEDVAIEITDSDEVQTFMMTDIQKGSLEVDKTVTGDTGEHERDFRFTLKLTDTGTVDVSSLPYVTSDGQTGKLVPDADGNYEFTLRDQQKITISGLPVGCSYEVLEKDGVTSGYDVTAENETGTVSASPVPVHFTNYRTREYALPDTGSDALAGLLLGIGTAGAAAVVSRRRRKRGR